MHKLGIVVPYRSRSEQLAVFRKEINDYLEIDFELIITEQADKKQFNRGKLLNIGFLEAERLGCDYVIFHDIDMLPIDADYSYVNKPTHLITEVNLPDGVSRTLFDEYFGGVTAFPVNLFKQINGYSNEFFGWGFEDDDLLLRCLENHIDLNGKKTVQKGREGVSLEFNGKDSFVAIPNKLTEIRDFTIYTSFGYNDIMSDVDQVTDENSIFSIPGFDTTLTVNSFFDLTFQFWKKDLSSISLPTKGLQAGRYNATITVSKAGNYLPPLVKFYLNGKKVGQSPFDKMLKIRKQKYIYLGVGDPERKEKNNWFKGTIDTFATYSEALTDEQCAELGNNFSKSLFSLNSKDYLTSYYDMKFVNGTELLDLKGGRNGRVFNCNQTLTQTSRDILKPIPHRKKGKFKVLPHKENGYKDGYWISWTSRENQLRYLNNYYTFKSNYQRDGLTSCKYKERNRFESKNYHHLEVML